MREELAPAARSLWGWLDVGGGGTSTVEKARPETGSQSGTREEAWRVLAAGGGGGGGRGREGGAAAEELGAGRGGEGEGRPAAPDQGRRPAQTEEPS